jgi:hypothetical protein
LDADPETLDWIQKGGIAATIAQKPYTMAYVGMQMLDILYHHKPAALGKRLGQGYLCAGSELRGYWFGFDRQDEPRFFSAGGKEFDFGAQVGGRRHRSKSRGQRFEVRLQRLKTKTCFLVFTSAICL